MVIEFEYKLDIEGHIINTLIQAEGSIYTDSNYGADADGNRGVEADFLEDLTIKVLDSRNNDITNKLQNKYKIEWLAIETECEEKILDNYNE